MDLGFCGDDVAEQRLGSLDVDGEIIVDEKNRHLAFFGAGASLQQEQFVDYALVGAKANRIAEETGDGAELATVGAAASGFDRNNAKRSPAFADILEESGCGFGHEIKLLEIDRLPRNHGVFLQRRLALLAKGIDRFVNIFE